MMLDGFPHHVAVRDGADDLRAHVGVHFHQLKFIVAHRARFVKHAFGDEDFADVVNAGRIDQIGRLFRGETESPSNDFRIACHQIAMARSLQFTRLSSAAKRFDRFLQQRYVAIFLPAAKLIQR